MDKLDRARRSRVMGRIRGDLLGPELRAAEAVIRLRLDFRRNDRSLPGRPDFALHAERLAIFVHGCFWHGCAEHFSEPVSRAAWWRRKVSANRARDRRAEALLRAAGWRCLVIWEHDTSRGVPHLAGIIARHLRPRTSCGGRT